MRQRVALVATLARLYVGVVLIDRDVPGRNPAAVADALVTLLLAHVIVHIGVVLVENAGRFARDLAVQLTGHKLLRKRGIELIRLMRRRISRTRARPRSWCARSSAL